MPKKPYPLDEFATTLKANEKFRNLFESTKSIFIMKSHYESALYDLKEFEKLFLKVIKPEIDLYTKQTLKKEKYLPSQFFKDDKGRNSVYVGDPYRFRKEIISMAYISLYHKIEIAEVRTIDCVNRALNI